MYKLQSETWANLFSVKLDKDKKLEIICELCDEDNINGTDETILATMSYN